MNGRLNFVSSPQGDVKRLLRKGLGLVSLLLFAVRANAVVINVNGTAYDVTYFTGSYNDNAALLMSQPWWHDPDAAQSAAAQVGPLLGAPSAGIYGPNFLFGEPTSDVTVSNFFAYNFFGNTVVHGTVVDPVGAANPEIPYAIVLIPDSGSSWLLLITGFSILRFLLWRKSAA